MAKKESTVEGTASFNYDYATEEYELHVVATGNGAMAEITLKEDTGLQVAASAPGFSLDLDVQGQAGTLGGLFAFAQLIPGLKLPGFGEFIEK
jgi:hypothetical protein